MKKEKAKESMPSLVSPKSLDDEWSKWIIGEWEGVVKSDIGKHKDWVKGKGRRTIGAGLNGQFLMVRGRAEITQLSGEYIQHLKETMHATDKDIEKIRSSIFEDLEVYTIDPKTGETVGYLFDCLRCIAEGRGKREGNKETMKWEWSAAGQGSSVRITEKVSDDKFIITEKYTMPDGSIMVDKAEMTRRKSAAEK
jgi:hypothetical protein